MTETVRVGQFHTGGSAMVAEQGAQPRRTHAGSACPALEGDKQSGRRRIGPLQPQIVIQQLDGFGSQGKIAGLVALAAHADLRLRQEEILPVQIPHLLRPQTLQQHQANDGQIACSTKARPESRHLVYGQGHDGPLRLSHPQSTHCGKRPAEAHGRASPIAYLKTWSNLTGSAREDGVQRAIRNSDALVDGGAGELGLLTGLESHIIQQGGLGERIFGNRIGVMNTLPPTDKVQQVLCIASEREVRHATEAFEIQIAIDPFDLAAGGLLDDAKRAACVIGGRLVNDAELHGRAASSSDWNWCASPPCKKKLLGSWPSGSATLRASKPCSRSLSANACAACWPLPLGSASNVRKTVRVPLHSCRN